MPTLRMMIPTALVAACLMVVAVGCKPPAPPTINIDADSAEVEGGSNTTAAVETPSNTTAAAETPAAETPAVEEVEAEEGTKE